MIRVVFTIIGHLSRKTSYKLASKLGSLWFAIDHRHRRIAIDNLTLVFGQKRNAHEIFTMARSVFHNIAKIPFEIAWSIRVSEKELLKELEIRGFKNFEEAYSKGKGALLMTVHAGNWELLPSAITSAGYCLNFVYRPLNFKPVNIFLEQYRTRFGAKVIPKHRSLRKILKQLKNKECVGILFDQDPGIANGVFVDFFNIPTCTNKGLAFLALRTGAPVVPVFMVREGMRFFVEIGKEIPLYEGSSLETNIIVNTAAYNRSIEEFILAYPEQWFWVHRRWKHSINIEPKQALRE